MSANGARRLSGLDVAMIVAALVALGALIAEHGFLPGPRWIDLLRPLQVACVVAFAGLQLVKLVAAEHPGEYFARHRFDFTLLFALGVQTVVYFGLAHTPEARWLERHDMPSPLWAFYTAILQVYVLVIVLERSTLVHSYLVRMRLAPARIMVASFAVLVGLGTLLLALPGAARDGRSLGFIDALFTATSAACVTGLVVVDTGTAFGPLGVGVVGLLIQAGGLGMLTITAAFALFGGRGLAPLEQRQLGRALDTEEGDEVRDLLRRVLWTTFVAEGLGAVALWFTWGDLLPSPGGRAAWAGFHAVSAFCNAGFALFPGNGSLIGLAGDIPTQAILGGLIVAGGLGSGVLAQLARIGRARLARRRAEPLSRHTRWVLVLTAGLIAGGAALFWLLERDRAFAHLPPGQRVAAALFQSVTLRTAGFNTVDLVRLALPSVVLSIVLMLVGGSPASTAGGMKTTTAAVAATTLLRRPRVAPEVRRRAVRLAGAFLGTYLLAWGALALAQGEAGPRVAFEAASALATVGLSLDYTAQLSPAGKLVVCAAMFAGRVGPFALAAALLRLRARPAKSTPAERILLG